MNFIRNLFVISIFLFARNVDAQKHWCGTDQSEAFMSRLKENQKLYVNYTPEKMLRYVPIQFFNVARESGAGLSRVADIHRSLCILNDQYESYGFIFYSVGIEVINDDDIYSGSSGLIAPHLPSIRNPNAINVFIAESSALGYYNRNHDFILINKGIISENNLNVYSYTFMHEIGHFFSLAHTHRGWEGGGGDDNEGPYDPLIHGDTVTITHIESGQADLTLIELMDGSNCLEAADLICDTPPNYGFGSACGCCTMVYDVWDANGDKIVPHLDNVMSYARDCVGEIITEQQLSAMVVDYESDDRNYLRNAAQLDTFTPITEPTVLLGPGSEVDLFDGILFTWEPTENAEVYVLEISDGSQTFIYETEETEYFVTDLEADGLYLWSVVACNKFGGSCALEETRLVFTGSDTSPTSDIDSQSPFQISPNPTSDFIEIKGPLNNNIFTIFDVHGKEIIQSIDSKIDVSHLSNAVYFIRISNDRNTTLKFYKI